MAAVLVSVDASGQTFVAEWSTPDIGRLGPTGLAIDTVGGTSYLYAVDQPLGRIMKIDLATFTRVAVWGQTGNGQLEFNSPYGIAVDPASHDLYIAERGNHRIQRITNTGQFVMGWGDVGTASGQFFEPIGVAVDATGHVYVTDHGNNRVQKFRVQQTSTGWDVQVVATWGGAGSANGQFNAPYGITLDAAGNVWVADARNHRLQKFDSSGRFLTSVGSSGSGDGQFVTPVWVAFDAAGAMYVAETNSDPANLNAPDLAHQRIQKFNPDGTFALKWGTYGEFGGQFKLPLTLVVDAASNVYVSDYYNTRLQKFSMTGGGGGGGGGGGAGATKLSNVSSRLRVSPTRPLIAGFVVSGSTSKQVLIRAAGPVLTQFGVSGALPNPKLQVYSGSTVVASNEDWGGDTAVAAAASQTGAFGFPNGSRDAALVALLPPGAYTAQVGDNGGDGVALVEIYDNDESSSKLINLSTRGAVDTGEGVLVAGFVVKGTGTKRVLIRGIGPTLAAFGVTGVLADPGLKVYGEGSVLVAQNNDWGVSETVSGGAVPATPAEIAAANTATRAFDLPSGSKDSAVLVTLQPGAYSAVLNGADGTTGEAVVEVYEVP